MQWHSNRCRQGKSRFTISIRWRYYFSPQKSVGMAAAAPKVMSSLSLGAGTEWFPSLLINPLWRSLPGNVCAKFVLQQLLTKNKAFYKVMRTHTHTHAHTHTGTPVCSRLHHSERCVILIFKRRITKGHFQVKKKEVP